jgi:hypothetical protein
VKLCHKAWEEQEEEQFAFLFGFNTFHSFPKMPLSTS